MPPVWYKRSSRRNFNPAPRSQLVRLSALGLCILLQITPAWSASASEVPSSLSRRALLRSKGSKEKDHFSREDHTDLYSVKKARDDAWRDALSRNQEEVISHVKDTQDELVSMSLERAKPNMEEIDMAGESRLPNAESSSHDLLAEAQSNQLESLKALDFLNQARRKSKDTMQAAYEDVNHVLRINALARQDEAATQAAIQKAIDTAQDERKKAAQTEEENQRLAREAERAREAQRAADRARREAEALLEEARRTAATAQQETLRAQQALAEQQSMKAVATSTAALKESLWGGSVQNLIDETGVDPRASPEEQRLAEDIRRQKQEMRNLTVNTEEKIQHTTSKKRQMELKKAALKESAEREARYKASVAEAARLEQQRLKEAKDALLHKEQEAAQQAQETQRRQEEALLQQVASQGSSLFGEFDILLKGFHQRRNDVSQRVTTNLVSLISERADAAYKSKIDFEARTFSKQYAEQQSQQQAANATAATEATGGLALGPVPREDVEQEEDMKNYLRQKLGMGKYYDALDPQQGVLNATLAAEMAAMSQRWLQQFASLNTTWSTKMKEIMGAFAEEQYDLRGEAEHGQWHPRKGEEWVFGLAGQAACRTGHGECLAVQADVNLARHLEHRGASPWALEAAAGDLQRWVMHGDAMQREWVCTRGPDAALPWCQTRGGVSGELSMGLDDGERLWRVHVLKRLKVKHELLDELKMTQQIQLHIRNEVEPAIIKKTEDVQKRLADIEAQEANLEARARVMQSAWDAKQPSLNQITDGPRKELQRLEDLEGVAWDLFEEKRTTVRKQRRTDIAEQKAAMENAHIVALAHKAVAEEERRLEEDKLLQEVMAKAERIAREESRELEKVGSGLGLEFNDIGNMIESTVLARPPGEPEE